VHENKGSRRGEQADAETFVLEQAIRLLEGTSEEAGLERYAQMCGLDASHVVACGKATPRLGRFLA
jgi:hypothetical protein